MESRLTHRVRTDPETGAARAKGGRHVRPAAKATSASGPHGTGDEYAEVSNAWNARKSTPPPNIAAFIIILLAEKIAPLYVTSSAHRDLAF